MVFLEIINFLIYLISIKCAETTENSQNKEFHFEEGCQFGTREAHKEKQLKAIQFDIKNELQVIGNNKVVQKLCDHHFLLNPWHTETLERRHFSHLFIRVCWQKNFMEEDFKKLETTPMRHLKYDHHLLVVEIERNIHFWNMLGQDKFKHLLEEVILMIIDHSDMPEESKSTDVMENLHAKFLFFLKNFSTMEDAEGKFIYKYFKRCEGSDFFLSLLIIFLGHYNKNDLTKIDADIVLYLEYVLRDLKKKLSVEFMTLYTLSIIPERLFFKFGVLSSEVSLVSQKNSIFLKIQNLIISSQKYIYKKSAKLQDDSEREQVELMVNEMICISKLRGHQICITKLFFQVVYDLLVYLNLNVNFISFRRTAILFFKHSIISIKSCEVLSEKNFNDIFNFINLYLSYSSISYKRLICDKQMLNVLIEVCSMFVSENIRTLKFFEMMKKEILASYNFLFEDILDFPVETEKYFQKSESPSKLAYYFAVKTFSLIRKYGSDQFNINDDLKPVDLENFGRLLTLLNSFLHYPDYIFLYMNLKSGSIHNIAKLMEHTDINNTNVLLFNLVSFYTLGQKKTYSGKGLCVLRNKNFRLFLPIKSNIFHLNIKFKQMN